MNDMYVLDSHYYNNFLSAKLTFLRFLRGSRNPTYATREKAQINSFCRTHQRPEDFYYNSFLCYVDLPPPFAVPSRVATLVILMMHDAINGKEVV